MNRSNAVTRSGGLGLLLAWAGLGAFSAFACEDGRSRPLDAAAARPSTSEPAGTTTPETRKKAKLTPEIIQASERLLAEQADAPIGSEFPMLVGGKRYTGRIEEHDNPQAEPGRPPGKHKGVTVYER